MADDDEIRDAVDAAENYYQQRLDTIRDGVGKIVAEMRAAVEREQRGEGILSSAVLEEWTNELDRLIAE